jgi:hypothetical protein
MKTILKIFLTIILAAIVFSASAQQYAQNYRIGEKKHYRYSDNFTDYEVQVKGDIKVNDNDTEIVSISPGGYLKVSKKSFGNKRSILIESNSNGKLVYEYYEGRQKIPFDPEGKKWLSDVLLDIIRMTGIDVEGRTKRIYKIGGIDEFVDEVDEIGSNSVSSLYFHTLLENHSLNEKELIIVIHAISRDISSNTECGNLYRDFSDKFMINNNVTAAYFTGISRLSSNSEMGSILRKITAEIDFNNTEVTEAYFTCIDRMSSNSERGNVMRHVENSQKLSEDAYIRLLLSVKKLSSNSEMGSILRSLDNMNFKNANISNAYFNDIDAMSSNSEAGQTLKYLIKNNNISTDNYIRLLKSVQKLSSNMEVSSVLRSITKLDISNPSINDEYFTSINLMSSNSEAGSVLRYAIKNYELDANNWLSLLRVTGKLSSNTEMGYVLRAALKSMPFDKIDVDAFLEATRKMSSNSEMSSVLMEMIKSEKLNEYTCNKILKASRILSSNTEKSKVLRAVASTKYIQNNDIKNTYFDVARTLSSDSEYRNVMEAINK